MADVAVVSGYEGITFQEALGTGVVQTTTIAKDGKSVHSRHTTAINTNAVLRDVQMKTRVFLRFYVWLLLLASWRPVVAGDHNLAVDQERLRLDASGSINDSREAVGPIMAVACEAADARAMPVQRQPIAS